MDGLVQFFSAVRGCERDSHLVMSLTTGDERSMAEFYDRWATAVYTMARLVMAVDGTAGGVVDATTATKATFLELWRSAPTRPPDQSVPAWVLATTQVMTRAQVRTVRSRTIVT